ncbi:hypothetical protein [Pseudobdellovibrio exovorus]|uniref:Uncharacterized protein n=1 Tax=Pseudobdellovibrio exovorus JSS TaxID=1184267 RepID=M4VFH3_9BACT|nr:hypothetical protein [Pseudobdellovibrio exovorus]AGH96801.1 hypothetical protein A11Q_2585 [Pseudobdellovibrio exovorus JSS]
MSQNGQFTQTGGSVTLNYVSHSSASFSASGLNKQGFSSVFRGVAGQIWETPFLSADELSAVKKYLSQNVSVEKSDVYTIGQPLYKNSADENALQFYLQEAQMFRQTHFAALDWLYSRVQNSLQQFLSYSNVHYHSKLAPPGFLLYKSNAPLSKPHFDFQARRVPKSWREGSDLNRIITFTLAIDVPSAGSGLYYWSTPFKDLISSLEKTEPSTDLDGAREWGFDSKKMSDLQFYNFLKTQERHFLPYQSGHLYLTIGGLLHQAGPTNILRDGETRITLQGHGLYHEVNGWELYW